jgi:hypothetical protein
MLLLEGSRRVAPDTELEAGSKEKRLLETNRQAMARKQDEAPQKKTKKKKKKEKKKKLLHWYEGLAKNGQDFEMSILAVDPPQYN